MDPRKPKNGVGGGQGRIPVNRTPFNPPNQTPNQANMPQPRASIPRQNQNRIPHRIRHQIPQQIPQPQPYYPQPAYSQGYVYGPLPSIIHSYVIEQTAEVEFDPFLHTRNTPLPDDDVAIPETQEQPNMQEQPNTQDDVQEVQAQDVLGKKKKRAEKQPWSQEEEEALTKA
uniref:uncharacterized protein LOC122597387 n=1 Tax=Erigeron canadensis TaxID=72917 RepID=UPI001CB8D50E|nr:uncharacterized protein LOC122597387 [Erigeron canadensis]